MCRNAEVQVRYLGRPHQKVKKLKKTMLQAKFEKLNEINKVHTIALDV